MTGLWTLLIAIVLVRFIPERESQETKWNGFLEVVIALSAGLAFALLGTFWFSRFHIVGETLSSDLYDFCGSVAAMRDGALADFSRDRSLAAGYLPTYFAERYGLVNGLVISSIISLGVIGSGLYIWARALSSRLAGLLAVIFALSLAPIVLLGRTITFYPEYVAVFTLASGLTCLAVKQRRPFYYLLGGLGVAACLLIDLRGFVWALPLSMAAIIAALALRSRHSLILIAIFVMPIWGSWSLGSHVYSSKSTPLEAQFNAVRLFYEHGSPENDTRGIYTSRELPSFVWGRTPIRTIPDTLYNLLDGTRQTAPLMRNEEVVVRGRNMHLIPLLYIGGLSFIGALISTIRKPLKWSSLILTASPFLAVLYHATNLEFRHRFAASALPIVAIFFGLAVSWVIQVQLPKNTMSKKIQSLLGRIPKLRSVLVLVICGAAVTGIFPSTLSPNAPWRTPFVEDSDIKRLIMASRFETTLQAQRSGTCVRALTADFDNGLPVGATILSENR